MYKVIKKQSFIIDDHLHTIHFVEYNNQHSSI